MNSCLSTGDQKPAPAGEIHEKTTLFQNGMGPKKRKVLLIDDEAAFSNILKMTLELDLAYKVCVENDARQAVATARKFWPDIVILDVVMPDLDGGEVQAQFLADPILKRIPIIFLTAIVQEKEVNEHQGMIGGSLYVAKPVSANRLIELIENTLRSRESG